MGIPSYFAFLVKKYENIIKYYLDKSVSRLYLDLNCAIHPCCKKVIDKYGDSIDNEILEKKMIKEILDYIDLIFSFTNPKELLYISIDGPAPRAKMSQQRQRRYKSISQKKKENSLRESNGEKYIKTWDTNAITPGTIFMKKLSDSIEQFIEGNNKYKKLCVILSDSNVYGEGEHKILKNIKEYKKKNDEDCDIIYGLDADLIMLSLASQKNNIYLLREPTNINSDIDIEEPFLYLDIDCLKYHFLDEIEERIKDIELSEGGKIEFKINLDNFIRDYIFICYLLGNDFLPHIPSLTIKDGGINLLISIYLDILTEKKIYLTDNDKISSVFFKKLLERLSELEETFLFKQYNYRKKFILRPNENLKSNLDIELFNYDNYPLLNKELEEKVDIGSEGWQNRYYQFCFGNKKKINKYCKDYLEGLIWTFKYYTSGCISWEWYYPHRNSPLISDIFRYVKDNNFDFDSINFEKTEPFNPFTQLLLVLPSESNHLLPKSYQNLVVNHDSEIIDYYPIDFKVDTFHRRYLWQCPPIIPSIDLNRIKKTISNKKFTFSETERNKLGSDIIKKNFSLKFNY